MKYENMCDGKFIKRLNRFTAVVDINGREETVHVKNTGRLKELLIPGSTVYLSESDISSRKTKYDLVSVEKDGQIVNIDSQAPNKVFGEYLKSGGLFNDIKLIKPETFFGSSRFDFYIETEGEKIFAEVKGVTLKNGKVAMFPDAPTERGVKHINELCLARKNGYGAMIIFVVQMKGVTVFKPNRITHRAFADALIRARNEGVAVKAFDCIVTENELKIDKEIKILLEEM